MLLIWLFACEPPPSCDQMCGASAAFWSECAASESLGWDATPFAGRADHDDWCETWVWEQQQLDDDLAATCAQRSRRLRAATCDNGPVW